MSAILTTRAPTSAFAGNWAHSVLSTLPEDMLFIILSRMAPCTLSAFSLSCKYIQVLSREDCVWAYLFHAHFPFDQTLNSNAGTYLEVYKKAHKESLIHQNLMNGVYALHTLTVHTHKVSSLALESNRLCTGSWDGTLKVWDLQTKECVNSLSIAPYAASSFAMKDDQLYVGTLEGKVLIPDFEHKEYVILDGFQNLVNCLAIGEDKLYAKFCCSQVGILDLREKGYWEIFKTLESNVSSLIAEGNKLYVSSYDSLIHIYDSEDMQFCEKIDHLKNLNSILSIEGNKLYLCSDFNYAQVMVLDLQTKDIFMLFNENQWRCPASMAFAEGRLVLGYMNGTVEIMDYSAFDKEIFAEIAELFRSENPQAIAKAMERFLRMPEKSRKRVYEELSAILKPFPNEGESAFHHLYEMSSTPVQKAQAIENHLNHR